MQEFHEAVMPGQQPEVLDIDRYLSSGPEGEINQLSILNLFGKEKLEKIQQSLSKATGLGFVTVDFRGNPITETTYFSRFCQMIRTYPCTLERCKSSDAFGAIQAAVTQKTNVYYCPCGLMEVAIPIIVRGHYLGGFIGGQIRCNDAPDSVSRLGAVMYSQKSEELTEQHRNLFEEIPIYSYEKFQNIADLVFLVINQLGENQVNRQMQEDVLNRRIKRIQASNQRYMKENKQKTMRLKELEVMSNPYIVLDALTSMINLSVIEEAPQTNEMLTLFAEYFKYLYSEKETLVYLANELEHAERYLLLQKKRFGDRMDYSIQVPKEMHMQKIPSGVLILFVEHALYYGIMPKKEGGKITISGYEKNNRIVLEINDTGVGLTDQELDITYELYKDKHEGYYIKKGISYAKEKLKYLYGDDYDLIVESDRNKGRKCILIWPERLEERT